jgi:peptidoglycan/LPS O-acetylase OafA/YrhL
MCFGAERSSIGHSSSSRIIGRFVPFADGSSVVLKSEQNPHPYFAATPPQRGQPMRRILELDALRGIFALTIMLAHIGLIPDSRWVFSTVDLFFVLSGYFITTNILKNRNAPRFLAVFFTRRALRIWPAYYLALAACLLLNRTLKWDTRPDAWPYYLTFTQNVQAYLKWPLPKFSGMFLHTWTLAIEEQFYIIWPLLLFRAGKKTRLTVIVAFVLLPPVLRALGYNSYLLLTRSDGLAMGSLLAILLFDRGFVASHMSAYRAGFVVIGLGALLAPGLVGGDGGRWLAVCTGMPWEQLGPALFTTRACATYFGLGGAALCFQGHPLTWILREKRLCYVGTVSYGLYLYHPMVFAALPGLYKRLVFRHLGLTSTLLMDLVMLAVCFALAELSRRLLEGPVMALKDRWTYRTAGVDPAQYGLISSTPVPIYRGPHTAAAAKDERFIAEPNPVAERCALATDPREGRGG